MRWGIFWRTLKFEITECGNIINAAMLLHNFLVDERLKSGDDDDMTYFSTFCTDTLLTDSNTNETELAALVVDNGVPRPGGRPTNADRVSKARGELLREKVTAELWDAGKQRVLRDDYIRNPYGHVYLR
jgi:hypothetical protein